MTLADVVISAIIPRPPHTARHTPPCAWRLLLSESLHPSAIDSLHLRLLLGSVLGSVQSSRLGVCKRVQLGAYLGAYSQAGRECAIERNQVQSEVLQSVQSS